MDKEIFTKLSRKRKSVPQSIKKELKIANKIVDKIAKSLTNKDML